MSVISPRHPVRASVHADCRDGIHHLVMFPNVEITCEQWEDFVQWQKNYLRYHDPVPAGQYIDVPRYFEHKGCRCRNFEQVRT